VETLQVLQQHRGWQELRARLQPGDQFLQVIGRQGLPCDHEQRLRRDERHRLEVVQGVVWERENGGVEDVRGPAA
jgi:hypothetical protein